MCLSVYVPAIKQTNHNKYINVLADFLIIGGLGDLAFRKLYPALFYLEKSGYLLDGLRIIAMGRKEISNTSFVDRVRDGLATFGKCDIDEKNWEKFSHRLVYFCGDAVCADSLSMLRDEGLTSADRDIVIYLATPPYIILPICHALQKAAMIGPHVRIVVEKPLGNSLESFTEINNALLSICDQQQVYKIDHYLGKEAVQNLLSLRFANTFLEPLWNNHYIDHVQINVLETVGVEGRWEFYDNTGALRDMVQNHLLQLLCLVAMDPPNKLAGASMHSAKLKVLLSLRQIDDSNLRKYTVRGQYTDGVVQGQPVAGYLQEQGAGKNSTTETFVAIKAYIDNWRWGGVPFYLRTGKRMLDRYSEIVIQFRDVPHHIFGQLSNHAEPNRLVIRLQPDEGIRLYLMNKIPGVETTTHLKSVALNLSLSEVFAEQNIPDAYERLLLDVLRGNDTLFMRSDELELAWQWVDSIIATWQRNHYSPIPYAAGSVGPIESIAMIAKDHRNWY